MNRFRLGSEYASATAKNYKQKQPVYLRKRNKASTLNFQELVCIPEEKKIKWGALRDVTPFVQFKKRKKHSRKSVFFTFLKLYK